MKVHQIMFSPTGGTRRVSEILCSGMDKDTAKCISCMKCVSVCPTGARSIGAVMNFLATQGLKKVCATRKENEMYI